MRRSIKSVFKFLIVAVLTVIVTVVIFRSLRPLHADSLARSNFLPVPPEDSADSAVHSFKLGRYNDKIDWHNYKLMKKESERIGVGEQGKAAYLNADENTAKEDLYKVNGFNALLSDKIALNRSLPDIRHKGCQDKLYYKKLSSVTVIVPFHNEHWSTLLRTAFSVYIRSPPELLKEIILVDDCSTKSFLKEPLVKYLAENLPIARVIGLKKRVGLIRARLAGAIAATADVLVFLDSHTEANVNWLPPLLDPIAEDYRICVCPFIDVIDFETFEYRAQDEGQRGAFDWEFFYKRLPLLPEDLKKPTEPFKSPVMAGGLFAITAKFFWELGGYDEGLDIWGGEQYELSFKIWQCGGQLVDAPCSRVGHIYRKFAPFPNPGRGDFVGKNYKRVAEVWMDEYAEYLYLRRPHYRKIDPGDLTKQREVRTRLKCKPFKWFMKEIAFDLPLKYPPIEPPDFADGEIKSEGAPDMCVDTEHKSQDESFGLKPCTNSLRKPTEQKFVLTWHKDIRPKGRTMCWDVSSVEDRASVNLFSCHGGKGNQLWRYDVNQHWLVHGNNPRCLEADPGRSRIYVTQCKKDLSTQKWTIENINMSAMSNWDKVGPP